MNTTHWLVGWALTIPTRMQELQKRREQGAETLEVVIILSVLAVAAVALGVVIVAAINSFSAKIPNG